MANIPYVRHFMNVGRRTIRVRTWQNQGEPVGTEFTVVLSARADDGGPAVCYITFAPDLGSLRAPSYSEANRSLNHHVLLRDKDAVFAILAQPECFVTFEQIDQRVQCELHSALDD